MKKVKEIRIWLLGIIILISTSAFTLHSLRLDGGDALIGVWMPSHGKAKVKITKVGTKYYGKIVWLKEPNYPDGSKKRDKNNPDPKMHETPLLGYKILKDFEYSGEKTWGNGTIYDPENGSTYSCTIKLTDKNTIDVRGFIGVSMIGRTDTWKRLKE
ncbi:MAG: DUF2147 domain-containing protein [Cryomorphaceae bacterium]|jgi:uncharacterized protein (DUF2147 family)|nr:DUF2147 domain-containing protein [Cryomorphaceae bacterium]